MKVTSYRKGDAGDFAFTAENEAVARAVVARYPEGRQASAVLPLLDLAQRQNGGSLSREALNYVANYLEMAPIRVYEVASFYSMLHLRPVGTHLVQICRTTPCWLRGAAALTDACKAKLGIRLGETTPDGKFSLVEVECLGACANAPMVQINDHYYEDLTPERLGDILDDLAAGKEVAPGPQTGRLTSAPAEGATTLKKLPEKKPADPTGALTSAAGEGA